MKTITISESEYLQMKELIRNLQMQLALFQDSDFMQKLQTFIVAYIALMPSSIQYLPIIPAEKIENKENSFGMWANRDISLESLRQQAWKK
jgi:hypothetical protein